MTKPEDPDAQILRQAQELLATRMDLIAPLAAAMRRREEARRELAEVDAFYSAHYHEAVRSGWTPEELKAIGAEDPGRRPRGRPAGRRTRKKKPEKHAEAVPNTTPQQGSPQGRTPTAELSD